MEKKLDLNLRPKASVYRVFERINYNPEYAIAEFVDNSTASFFTNEVILNKLGQKSVEVNIGYDVVKNILTIEDNAYGMELKDFERAIQLDSRPEKQGGRNEFGMGLKTAACWFGREWSVRSTQYGSNIEYYAKVNIEELEKGSDSIKIETKMVDPASHGTTIKIGKITKKMPKNTVDKIKKMLASMYRRDIDSGKVEIIYNNENYLKFKEYEPLTYKDKIWKKELNFNIEFDGTIHNVTGFVGILSSSRDGGDSGFSRAGFALFRRDRIIIGGENLNYKPLEIFGQAQSQISLKLYGEINLDSFPVNQAKDGFVWDDGLEYEFIKQLKFNIAEYIKIADLSKQARTAEETMGISYSSETQIDTQRWIDEISIDKKTEIEEKGDVEFSNIFETSEGESDILLFERQQEEDRQENSGFVSHERIYTIPMDNGSDHKKITVVWTTKQNKFWFEYENDKVRINRDHAFFKPYSNKPDFIKLIEMLVISMVMAEERAGSMGSNLSSKTIRLFMNEFLRTIPKYN